MRYDFKCTNDSCRLVTEHIQPMAEKIPEEMICPACSSPSKYKYAAPAIVGERSNESFDARVGRDSERKWSQIRERQDVRDKVRRDTGSVGLVANSFGTFTPISEAAKRTRTQVTEAAGRDGYRQEADSQ